MTTTTPYLVRIDSPVGELRLVATASALIAVLWPEERDGRVRFPIEPVDGSNAILDRTATQLREYFEGTRRTFDVPLELRGTDFQQSVWLALAEIPFAETSTYSKQAAAVGRPRAPRAVGGCPAGHEQARILLRRARGVRRPVLPEHRRVGGDDAAAGGGRARHGAHGRAAQARHASQKKPERRPFR